MTLLNLLSGIYPKILSGGNLNLRLTGKEEMSV